MRDQRTQKSRDFFITAFSVRSIRAAKKSAKMPILSYASPKMEGLEAILGGRIFPQRAFSHRF